MQCEGCFEQAAGLYCPGCKRNYCEKCDSLRHPAHHRSVISQDSHYCERDSELITMFCCTCSRFLCSVCLNEHHSLFHNISSVPDVYRESVAQMQKSMFERGFNRKRQIEERIESRNNEVKQLIKTRERIEEQMSSTTDAVVKRVELKVNPWISTLQREFSDLQRDMHLLDHSMKVIESRDPVFFLNNYRETIESLHTIADKKFYSESDFNLGEIPRELTEMRKQSREYLDLEKLNSAKNDILWDLSKGRYSSTNGVIQRELLQWSRLTDRYLAQLSNYRLYCYFCKLPLNEENVNADCSQNANDSTNQFLKDPRIPPRYIGTFHHYFVKANNTKLG